jgi:cell division transport system permease protein
MNWRTRWQQHDAAEVISILVMACAVALPALLWQLQQALSQSLEQRASGAVVMFLGADLQRASALLSELEQHPLVDAVEALSAKQAAESFADFLGLSASDRAQLPERLVPATVALRLHTQVDPDAVDTAIAQWQSHTVVDSLWWDRASLERSQQLYFNLRNLGRGLTLVLLLAGVGIVAADVNARLARTWKHIQVQTLLGATDEFILRPYLSRALLLGGVAGGLSLILLAAGIAGLQGVLQELSQGWGQSVQLRYPRSSSSLLLVLAPAALCACTTAWVVLSRLRQHSIGRPS